jgi:hypothetical protein
MKALLVRVAADQSEGGGRFNGPVDAATNTFAYVPIPESKQILAGHERPYSAAAGALKLLDQQLPSHLASRCMHLDPDFEHLTYGDQGARANQIQSKVASGDLLVFYAGLRSVQPAKHLVYAIIGIYVISGIVSAPDVPPSQMHENAHTRRKLSSNATDIVVRAKAGVSGRLRFCLPIGDYRARAYRVRRELLTAWGGLSVNDGYLQRSARLPEFNDAQRFHDWFKSHNVPLDACNF